MVRRAGLGRGLDALLPPAGDVTTAPPPPAPVAAPPPPPPVAGTPPVLEPLHLAPPASAPEADPAPASPVGAERSPLRQVPIADIRPNVYQPRTEFDDEALDSLTESIRELGVLQPVLVRRRHGAADGEDGEETFELIAGERRWRAALQAGLSEVPALVREDIDDQHALQEALVENVQRENLNPLEEAAAYQQLIDEFGFTQEQVAKAVGRGRPTVANTLRLLQLPTSVQRLVAGGSLSAGHARALLALDDADAVTAAAERAVAEGWSVRTVEDLVRAATQPAVEPAPRARPDVQRPASVLEVEERLSTRLDTRVQVQLGTRNGKLVVSFADLADLDRIFRLLAGGADGDAEVDRSI
jgi:ParB family transcriptional regulator, chromosome partitioning protein